MKISYTNKTYARTVIELNSNRVKVKNRNEESILKPRPEISPGYISTQINSIAYPELTNFLSLMGLSHEMDMAFGDIHGQV